MSGVARAAQGRCRRPRALASARRCMHPALTASWQLRAASVLNNNIIYYFLYTFIYWNTYIYIDLHEFLIIEKIDCEKLKSWFVMFKLRFFLFYKKTKSYILKIKGILISILFIKSIYLNIILQIEPLTYIF